MANRTLPPVGIATEKPVKVESYVHFVHGWRRCRGIRLRLFLPEIYVYIINFPRELRIVPIENQEDFRFYSGKLIVPPEGFLEITHVLYHTTRNFTPYRSLFEEAMKL